MERFKLFLWKRLEESENGNLWSKTDTAKSVVESKKYKELSRYFNISSRYGPKKEAFNLFKLVTDPRQKPYFKSRHFTYEGSKKNIPQEKIDYLMQLKLGKLMIQLNLLLRLSYLVLQQVQLIHIVSLQNIESLYYERSF